MFIDIVECRCCILQHNTFSFFLSSSQDYYGINELCRTFKCCAINPPELTKPGWRMRRINVTKQVLVTPALIPPLTHSLDVWTNSNDQSMSFSNCDTSESLSVTISDPVCSLQKRVRDVKYSWIIGCWRTYFANIGLCVHSAMYKREI